MSCIHFGRSLLPMLHDLWPVWTIWCSVHCFGQLFSAWIDCIGGLSRKSKNLFAISSREVLQVGRVAVNEVSCAVVHALRLVAEQISLASLSAQCEAQEEKLLNDVWEWWLRVNSQFGNVNVTSIINNPTVEERKNAANRAVSQGSGRQN